MPDGPSTTKAAELPAVRRADGRATAEQLVLVAERLFSERGVEAVSLREVGKAASSRNTAATQYHFGGKEGLVRAIVDRRAPVLNARRLQLLQELTEAAELRGVPPTVTELVRVLALPLIEESTRGSHYVGFLSRLAMERHRAPWVAELDEQSMGSFARVASLLRASLPELDRQRFIHRRDMLVQLVVTSLAAWQQQDNAALSGLGRREDFVRDLLEAAVGILVAPVGSS
jgi:AcrR family transcriptional regulator